MRTPAQPTPLRTRNYRLYFSGQLISVPGTWLQTVAQAWLVLTLSSSGTALGITVALQTVPVLVLGAWTGWAGRGMIGGWRIRAGWRGGCGRCSNRSMR